MVSRRGYRFPKSGHAHVGLKNGFIYAGMAAVISGTNRQRGSVLRGGLMMRMRISEMGDDLRRRVGESLARQRFRIA